ncbi:hypothetical protein HY639_05050 [Candidatus Woesearchaeota archaeon]|nr:hypothetical protein [Candidatus Woesearchaeota archaeon]
MGKGFLAEVLPLIMTMFLLALLLLIFFAWLSLSMKERVGTISSASSKSVSTYELLALLQTPVSLENETILLGDALMLAVENPQYRLRVHDELFQYMSLFHEASLAPLCGYLLQLEDLQGKKAMDVHTINFATTAYLKESIPFRLPSYAHPGKTYRGDFGTECSQY